MIVKNTDIEPLTTDKNVFFNHIFRVQFLITNIYGNF